MADQKPNVLRLLKNSDLNDNMNPFILIRQFELLIKTVSPGLFAA
jgi:hypothetical protein